MITIGTPLLEQSFVLMLMVVLVALILVQCSYLQKLQNQLEKIGISYTERKDFMIKLLLGASPCTYWSIAKREGREVVAAGQGWELFKNFLIAKEQFKPDFFLYENNQSMSSAIKEQISNELRTSPIPIDSALVSAQMRKRYYWLNGIAPIPEDRGIVLRDILENDVDLTCNDKAYCLTARYGNCVAWNTLERKQRNMVAIRVGNLPKSDGTISTSQAYRVYSIDGKSVNLVANGGGIGAKTGLYAIPSSKGYIVQNGQILIRDKWYDVKLDNGIYEIRKLTPVECERLQTLPDNFTAGISNSQRYKCLGNGWTAEVIIHLLSHLLKDVPRNEELQVVSLYDGIATGRYCLDKLGFTNVKYSAYEIDNFAIKVAKNNYPDIIELGDAFQVRNIIN